MRKGDLDTPFVIIDVDKVEKNISNMQAVADDAGVFLRPHAKTHKMPYFAHKQIRAGAVGITVAKIGEAEVMADAGIQDILIAYPIVGQQKIERLVHLAKRVNMVVALDSFEAAYAISMAAAKESVVIAILLELDCGFHRVGLPQDALLALAQKIVTLPGVVLRGIATFGGQAYDAETDEDRAKIGIHEAELAVQTAQLLRERGITLDVVSVGSTPTSKWAAQISGVTEIRPGTYIFGDLMQVQMNAHQLADCALTVKVTVVSRPAEDRAVVDAGTKVFTADGGESPIGTGRGFAVGHPGITVQWLTEEHGMLVLSNEERALAVGDTLEIIPVHACAVVNMVDEVALVRGDEVENILAVAARGKSR